jgi:hypothetical protein
VGKTGRVIYRKIGGGLRDGLRVGKRRRVKGKKMGGGKGSISVFFSRKVVHVFYLRNNLWKG